MVRPEVVRKMQLGKRPRPHIVGKLHRTLNSKGHRKYRRIVRRRIQERCKSLHRATVAPETPRTQRSNDQIPKGQTTYDQIPSNEIAADEISNDVTLTKQTPNDQIPANEIPTDPAPNDQIGIDELPIDEEDIEEAEIKQETIDEIRRGFCFRKQPFENLIKEIGQDVDEDLQFSDLAMLALQSNAESYLVGLFKDAYLCMIHDKRVTLMLRDMKLTRGVRGEAAKPYPG